jgi:16S rRNA (guanine1207-N2)-methyltransferase
MSEHYYTKNPKSTFYTKEFSINLFNKQMIFYTGASVFSIGKLDTGTKLLIENCIIKDEDDFKLLDLGCGYGIVGIALKKKYPKISVTCSDINNRAVELTKKNSFLNKTKIETLQSDIFENLKDKLFDTILINLPQNAGKDICFKIITESFDHLKNNGTLQTVSRHQKGGKSYEKKMIEIFGNCEYVGKGSGYRIYLSKKIN